MQFWSGTAFMTTTDAVAVARMLDEADYDGIVTSDHMIYPRELSSPYPDSPTGKPMWSPDTAWPDSWVLTGAMAAVTKRLRFSNAVYIAPARPLLEVAKQVATASVVSDGRVSLAAGVGWMREEYELMGQDFDTRGRRLNEMIPALRALWRGGWVSWSGQYYQVPQMMIEPHPPAPVPILCGGESEAALRRAARLCDGWVGYAYAWDDAPKPSSLRFADDRDRRLSARHGRLRAEPASPAVARRGKHRRAVRPQLRGGRREQRLAR
jgi:probable F420-dependent oxidoreductase